MVNIKEKFSPLVKYFLIFAFIFLCAFYAFGTFDFLKIKNVKDLSFSQAGFSYTGKMLEGKFFENGIIKYENNEYNCSFKKGLLKDVNVYFKNTNASCDAVLSNNTIINANFKTKNNENLIYKDNVLKYEDFMQNVYILSLVDGIPSGTGKVIYKDQSTYEGELSLGLATGKGIFTSLSNDNIFTYEGDFQNGKFDGFGKYTNKEIIYQGNFKNGLPDGFGIYNNLKENLIYEGNFKDGAFNGEGAVKRSSGGVLFSGVWKNGKKVS